jgi:hypothetical protein
LTLFGCFGTAFGDSDDDDLDPSLDDYQGDNIKDVCPGEEIPLAASTSTG